ncbi:MAG: Eco57I restriction-modification methylase domain-containing protein [Thermoguttaceae bacterium]
MDKTFDQGRDEIANLCRYFSTNRAAFFAQGVKEADIRQSLIDPLFEALGWDVRNTAQVAPQYREVIPEKSLDVEGQQKCPDYTFRVGPLAKFYAEAKKCGVNINADPGPAFQLRRYGWSAKVAVSILTDFDELGVYDCTIRPRLTDRASYARVKYFRFDEYSDRWRELWDVFSREAVWSGAFDQYAASKRKRGTSEVDVEFLKEIEGWRDALARNIALRNKGLSSDDLNAAVQSTIDRVVFLRMAEDRGFEPYEQLLKLCERDDTYARFMRDVCRRADEKYNSGLFHFQKESDVSEAPDRITPKLTVDDKVFKPILQSLYFAHGSPYHFGVLPVEILGTVYERFLGKVIRLTAGHQAKVEEKPEVRKAGGVYYTPAYIVDYIVKHTIGGQVEGRSPAQLAGGKDNPPFRVLDMACGSGSFLLGAYQCLLDHCLKWYVENEPERAKKAVCRDPRNDHWRLTIGEKKRILTTHVCGVDIDAQAVEVTKLSLLLKVLEGENAQTMDQQLQLFDARALPNLAENIKCGNSLIGPNYFTGKLIPDLDEMKRVNPFDWKQGFPDAMKAGGFDCIIGNPPYVRIQAMKEWAPLEVEIYRELFEAGRTGNYDIYVVFIEQGLRLLKAKGQLGFICPSKFFSTDYGSGIRGLIGKRNALSAIVDFGAAQVFDGATTYTCLLFLSAMPAPSVSYAKVEPPSTIATTEIPFRQIAPHVFGDAPWSFSTDQEAKLVARLVEQSVPLGELPARIARGSSTGADDVFMLIQEGRHFLTRQGERINIESGILSVPVYATDFNRYTFAPRSGEVVVFPYTVTSSGYELMPEPAMRRKFPKAYSYLAGKRWALDSRKQAKAWYGFSAPRNLETHDAAQILVPLLATTGCYCRLPDHADRFCLMASGGFSITVAEMCGLSPNYVIGLLNSRLLFWRLRSISNIFRAGWITCTKQYVETLPIRTIDPHNAKDRSAHDRTVSLVDSMLALHKQLDAAKSEARKTIIRRQIDAADAEIDRLVYDLYGLTAEEIAIVERG